MKFLDKISKRTVDTVKYSMGLEKRSLDPKSRNHCQRHNEIGLDVYLQLNGQLNSLSEQFTASWHWIRGIKALLPVWVPVRGSVVACDRDIQQRKRRLFWTLWIVLFWLLLALPTEVNSCLEEKSCPLSETTIRWHRGFKWFSLLCTVWGQSKFLFYWYSVLLLLKLWKVISSISIFFKRTISTFLACWWYINVLNIIDFSVFCLSPAYDHW